jgi:hypothetical protein
MTGAPYRTSEIAAYMAAVERHLRDLPESIRLDLMSELDLHLAEVAADLGPGMTLRDLLGSPESYARELRETAEIQKEPATTRLRRSLSAAAAPLTSRAKTAADGFAASTGHADAAELLVRLRPGWWVLRGAIVAALFVYWFAYVQFGVVGYPFFNSIPGLFLGVAVLLLAIWASIKIGMRTTEWGRRRRRVTAAAGIAIVALAANQFSWIITGAIPTRYVETQYIEGTGYDHVTDIHVYDENGDRLKGIYLFDQDGDPLWIGDPSLCEESAWNDPFAEEAGDEGQDVVDPFAQDIDRSELGYLYPLCGNPGEAQANPSDEPGSAAPTETTPPTAAPTGSESPTAGAGTTPGEDAPTTK